jgi:hypothetical protein
MTHPFTLFAAITPPPDSAWIPVLALIFAVPIGAFLALYALATCFLFDSHRQLFGVAMLQVWAVAVNMLAVLALIESNYNATRYLVVPTVALAVSLTAAGIATYRAVRMARAANRPVRLREDEALTRLTEDR